MRISCEYQKLIRVLADISSVVDDSAATEDAKTIIFSISAETGLQLIGLNQYVKLRKKIGVDECDVTLSESDKLTDGVFAFQLRSKELMNYLNSYKTLRCTKAEEVIFETSAPGKIKCTVTERYTEAELERLARISNSVIDSTKELFSSYVFTLTPIKASVVMEISKLAYKGDEMVHLTNMNVQWHTKNMLPLLQGGASAYGHMVFVDDSVVVQSPAFFTVMKSMVLDEGIFTGMRLSQKAAAMLDKFLAQEEYIEAVKLDRMVYMKAGDSELFLSYDNGTLMYKNQLSMAKKDNVVTIDRIYLKDVLKRLSLVNETTEIRVDAENGVVSLSNSKFSQDITMGIQRGFDKLGVVSFKMLPEVINAAIIGADSDFVRNDVEFGGDIFIYFTPTAAKKGLITFSDASGLWCSLAGIVTK